MVERFAVHELATNVQVCLTRSMPALTSELEAEVERLWQAVSHRIDIGGAGKLFNGRVFSADTITPQLITGHLTEYRRIVAQVDNPTLFAVLGVRPLAVCGVLRCVGGVVVGRRHPGAVYEPGMWQLPPAGSVDASAVKGGWAVDLHRQMLNELEEELGLLPEHVELFRPLCAVEHPGSHIVDLGLELLTTLTGDEVLAAHKGSGNSEYQELRIIPEARLASFVTEIDPKIVPSAREFLVRAKLLPEAFSL